MSTRPIMADDEQALRAFFGAIPEGDANFFKEDVTDPEVLRRWLTGTRDVRLVAVDDEQRIQAAAGVVPGVGRSAHVGDLRLVVAPECRRRGVGQELGRDALIEAVRRGMTKVTVEVAAQQEEVIQMFASMGFVAEALLGDHLREPNGELHDVVLMAHRVEANWQSMLAAGLDEVSA